MNKYKESFERIFGTDDYIEPFLTEDDRFLNVVTRIINKKDYLTLKELIEKATPKKPIHSYDVELDGAHRDFYNCPNCRSELGDEIYNYCQWCGQKIDGKDLEDSEDMEWL